MFMKLIYHDAIWHKSCTREQGNKDHKKCKFIANEDKKSFMYTIGLNKTHLGPVLK